MRREELKIDIAETGAGLLALAYYVGGRTVFAHTLARGEAVAFAIALLRKSFPALADHVEAAGMRLASSDGTAIHRR